MSTITQVQLVSPQQLASADAVLYTTPTLTTAKIGRAVFVNTSASVVNITAGITPGTALGASTTLIPTTPLAPNQTYVSPELAGQVIPAASQLHAYASVASSVTVSVSGLIIQ